MVLVNSKEFITCLDNCNNKFEGNFDHDFYSQSEAKPYGKINKCCSES